MKRLLIILVGAVAMLASAAPAYAADKLPNLGMARVDQFTVDTSTMPGHKLLRYGAHVANVGSGAFEVAGKRTSTSDPTMSVSQHIFQTGGGFRSVATGDVLQYMTGEWRLRDLESGWLQKGSGHIAALAKHWYCAEDTATYKPGLPGSPAHGVYRSCGGGQPNLLSVTIGVSVGWADIYGPNSFQQWIDITHVPDGTYFLYSKADPNNFFQESNNNDNVTWTKISISGTKVRALQFGPHI